MFGDHGALLMQTWRIRQRKAGSQRPCLSKDPGIANGSARGRYPVNTCLSYHVEASLRRKKITAAEHCSRPGMLFYFAQKLPTTGPHIALLNRAAVNGDCRHAKVECAVKDLTKTIATFRRVVQSTPHLHGAGNVLRNRF